MKRITRKLVKTVLLTASFAALLAMAPTASRGLRDPGDGPEADLNNPCSSLPRICQYTWDPMTRCCIADPKRDCTDVCFGPIIH